MPKLKNVTAQEIDSALDVAVSMIMVLQDMTDRIEKGYCDDIAKPIEVARNFNSLARAASDFVSHVFVQSAMQEQRKEIAAMRHDIMTTV